MSEETYYELDPQPEPVEEVPPQPISQPSSNEGREHYQNSTGRKDWDSLPQKQRNVWARAASQR